MVEPLFRTDPEMSRQRKGNIMARQRMIVLYDRSETFKGLVIGTSNKTEILLGYSTLWGDMASALNPIGDLYKTQLRQLARALRVPSEIIDKAPSADLWVGQTDEGSWVLPTRKWISFFTCSWTSATAPANVSKRGLTSNSFTWC